MNSGSSVQSELSSKEQQLISVIESGVENQRKIAESTGFSLGMTNILLKRLVQKGYVKVVALNGRTLSYILTPRGFKEKLERSFSYFINSINYLNRVRDRIIECLDVNQDVDLICVLGKNELSNIVCEVLHRAQIHFRELVELDDSLLAETGNILIFCCEIDYDMEQLDEHHSSRCKILLPDEFIH